MEDINNVVDNTVEEVTEATEQLSFGQNLLAYGIGAMFILGVCTTGYLGYKGVKALSSKIKAKRLEDVEKQEPVEEESMEDDSYNDSEE